MKVLVCGYGSMGQRHADNARALGHEVRIYDPFVGSHSNFKTQRSAFAWPPEAVIIASPVKFHAEQFWTACAVTNGPIFVEKPLALSEKDFHYGSAYSRVTNRVRVGYMLRFHPGLQRLHEHAWQQPLLGARFCVSTDKAEWKGQPATYGDALLECSHELDLALWLLGPAVLDATHAQQSADGGLWQVQTAHWGGAVPVQFHLDTVRVGYSRSVELFADDLTLSWDWHPAGRRPWEATMTRQTRTLTENISSTQTPSDLYLSELKAFFDGDTTHACDLDEALGVLRLVDAARISATPKAP